VNFRLLVATLVAAFAVLFGACGLPFGSDEAPPPTIPGSHQAIEVEVFRGSEGSVLVLVPVTIGGQGPFTFALDTGSSRTVLDCDLVEELALEVTGEGSSVTGVTGASAAREIQIETWRIGQVELPPMRVIEIDLACGETGAAQFRGLLGSDVMSLFGSVTVDFEDETLLLGEP